METKKIIAIVGMMVFLSGCGASISSVTPPLKSNEQLILIQQAMQASATLTLTSSGSTVLCDKCYVYKADEPFSVHVIVHNEKHKPITSVRSWLSFDPTKLQVLSIDTETSAFDLTLSDENKINTAQGIVALGRSSPKPLTDETLFVANITMKAVTPDKELNSSLSFFDYQEGGDAHTGIYLMNDGKIYNIAHNPETEKILITTLPNDAYQKMNK